VRLTFVVHQFPPRWFTGTEQYALAVGQELQRRGHDVDVFALDPAFGEETGPWRESREVARAGRRSVERKPDVNLTAEQLIGCIER